MGIVKKKLTIVLCVCMLLSSLPVCIMPGEAGVFPEVVDDIYCGIVQEGKFFHDGREIWLTYYFIDVGKEKYDKLSAELGGVEYSGAEAEYEIHIYTNDKDIVLSDYAGELISFKGEFFEAHTIYHRRDIVFEIKEILPVP